jgi:hypothetical protein
MKGFNSTLFLGLFLVVIMSISVVSAQTLVTGKVYNSDSSNVISGAEVTAQCGSSELRSSVSKADGTYAILFLKDVCSLTDTVKVTLSNGYSGTGTNSLLSMLEAGDITKFSVVNLNGAVVTPTPSNGGGGGGGSSCTYNKNYNWQCSEWSACTSGLQTRTCNAQNNCGNTFGRPALSQTCTGGNSTKLSIEPEVTENNPGFFGGITGAVTGALGTVGTTVMIVFLIAVFGSAVAVRMVRKKKKLK